MRNGDRLSCVQATAAAVSSLCSAVACPELCSVAHLLISGCTTMFPKPQKGLWGCTTSSCSLGALTSLESALTATYCTKRLLWPRPRTTLRCTNKYEYLEGNLTTWPFSKTILVGFPERPLSPQPWTLHFTVLGMDALLWEWASHPIRILSNASSVTVKTLWNQRAHLALTLCHGLLLGKSDDVSLIAAVGRKLPAQFYFDAPVLTPCGIFSCRILWSYQVLLRFCF